MHKGASTVKWTSLDSHMGLSESVSKQDIFSDICEEKDHKRLKIYIDL